MENSFERSVLWQWPSIVNDLLFINHEKTGIGGNLDHDLLRNWKSPNWIIQEAFLQELELERDQMTLKWTQVRASSGSTIKIIILKTKS